MKQLVSDLRSILSLILLSWAVSMAPKAEKTSLALALRQHIRRIPQ
ncbi:hypothetical protein N182_18575 [Sinorhizobium sp. GL2]|nr:hypothetical protein N182_18575 [Sinorhizobium sp. GL2]